MGKIVLATLGSLGDLHPFIAIGAALKKRGFDPILAVPEDQVAKVRMGGLDAVAVFPSFDAITKRMDLDYRTAVKRAMSDPNQILDHVLLSGLSESVVALDAIADGADALVGSLFAFSAPIVAEKRRLPLINVLLQPMTMFSCYDPPQTPDFRMLAGAPVGPIGLRWNRAVYTLIRTILRHRYAGRINEARGQHGLGPKSEAPLLNIDKGAALTLCCWSPLFGPLQPDAPVNFRTIGFPTFDSVDGATATMDPALGEFLSDGSAPIVFTLGSFAVLAPGNFYEEAADAARSLGRRGVLLVGGNQPTRVNGDIITCSYAPHSMLFPQAAAIVHHGGIGTIGQALRAGKPQLVVPYMGDQYDNGRRIDRIGVGRLRTNHRLRPVHMIHQLGSLLDDPAIGKKAQRVAALIQYEDGASMAANEIERCLRSL